jgi:oligopeptide/dipeptide ABC transporter ATP-binding protein
MIEAEASTSSKAGVLRIANLVVQAGRGQDMTAPVTDVSLDVCRGEAFGIVGESGSGKSLTLRAVIDLLPEGLRRSGGSIAVRLDEGADWVSDVATLRGRGISMIFQEPMTALNPTMRVGDIVTVGARAHRGLSRTQAHDLAVELLAEVRLPDPEAQVRKWPHQLSGGQRQRVMIAMALATDPKLLLCDEPTTALDVEVQDQILQLLDRIRRDRHLAVIFVTHDLGVIRRLCERIAVMYAGQVVEQGTVRDVFAAPTHPYTAGLLASMPTLDSDPAHPLTAIPGGQPDPRERRGGCRFADRCEHDQPDCHTMTYALGPVRGHASLSACRRADELTGALS